MNKIAILPLKEMPYSCSECEIVDSCKLTPKYLHSMKHPNCALIEIDIDELEEAVNRLMMGFDKFDTTRDNDYNTIKSTIDKLGGKQ